MPLPVPTCLGSAIRYPAMQGGWGESRGAACPVALPSGSHFRCSRLAVAESEGPVYQVRDRAALVWTAAFMVMILALVRGPDYTFYHAADINDAAQIAVVAGHRVRGSRTVLLSPRAN